MGFTLPSLSVPIVKISNCLLAPSIDEMAPTEPEQACIRCGLCVNACPAKLLPQQLYWFSRGEEHEKARQHHLFDCIECGACAYVCPSNIPLVQYYRQEKAEIRALDQEAVRAAAAKERYENRLARLERDKQAREERHKKSAVTVSDGQQNVVNAALSRVRSKNSEATGLIIQGQLPDNQAAIAARNARKAVAKNRKLADEVVNNTRVNNSQQDEDPRKAAVAAALARVKAKKSAQAAPETVEQNVNVSETERRQAAVAAALARVKAKREQPVKAEPKTDTKPTETAAIAEPHTEPDDARKAAIAAAIARVKAKKSATTDSQ